LKRKKRSDVVEDPSHPVYLMSIQEFRGNASESQVNQLVGIREFMADTHGQMLDLPIRNNLCEEL
jgi:hypothetical protein